jgi:predicted nuclease with TOPRIM domain
VADTMPLRQRLEQRLKALQAEFETGQKVLADLEVQQASVRDTLLRLAGAISVLKEELDVAAGNGQPEPASEVADARHAG